jgi:SAM-dependent methyltransferase
MARYDVAADLYLRLNPDLAGDAVAETLLRLAGPVQGGRVLDLACGAGRVARVLAAQGAAVTGLDLSAALLDSAIAAERAEPLGIVYVLGSCADPGVLAGARFDAVVCHHGLSDIDDLDGCLATVARVLESGGRFTFSILHPCFPGWADDVSASWPPDGYHREGFWVPEGGRSHLRRQVGANHRLLSTYLNALARRGLRVEEAAEPEPPAAWTRERPGSVPVFLVVRCVRG